MPSNAWTQGSPLATASVKMVLAERVYVKAYSGANTYADPTVKLEGNDASLIGGGWLDLGIVAGSKVNLAYNKETKYVETGMERVRRGAYVTQKTATATFTLEQFDIATLERVSGLTATSFSGGKKLFIGQEDLVQKTLLFVGTNKVDSKEVHTFCKQAAVTFQIQDQDDARVLAVTADLFAFNPGSGADCYFTMFVVD